ncbi:MAG: hypothetical protein KDD44_13565 [Bdellovibrionales bacterium]|nr:hypothetical protein [Bdellovibrionales bacterium]
MKTNPYASPQTDPTLPLEGSADREAVVASLRWSIILLFGPALWNFWCFHQQLSPAFARVGLVGVIVVVNGALSIAAFLAVFFLALPLVERIAGFLHYLLGGGTPREQWMNILYKTLAERLLISSAGCAVLWALWDFFFYHTSAPVLVVSNVLAISAHVLAAWTYGGVLYRWWQARRSRHAVEPPTSP